MQEINLVLGRLPQPALVLLAYALSWIPFVPLMAANYQGIRMIGGQLGFTFLLHLPAFLFSIAGLWLSPLVFILPMILTALFDSFVIWDYFRWTGSTSALGLFVLIPGEAVILLLAFGVSWFFF